MRRIVKDSKLALNVLQRDKFGPSAASFLRKQGEVHSYSVVFLISLLLVLFLRAFFRLAFSGV